MNIDAVIGYEVEYDDYYVGSEYVQNDIEISNYSNVLEDFTKAIELKSDYPYGYYLRGLIKTRNRNTLGAIEDFNKAIELNPQFAEAFNKIGEISFLDQDYKSAISYYSKAIEIKPDLAEAYYNRGKTIITLIDLMKNPF